MWKVTTGQTLGHYGWDEEFVVYNSLSGDTHLLESFAMEILFLLQQRGPLSAAAVLDALGPLGDTGNDQPDIAELSVVLDQLQSLVLIDRV
ncbi:HPr-rel-A system PqqD family peptide chaperone [Massilia psychrophila]|uniref:HPr-rel-A system PqqD family protein n=1 Tax=Massilia psychrophila TaxID=1603353 RepID=A0A2G8T0Z7_9BURK|nr:HPr-rel-A system PqqD family peptide chaperone [Massilia psychrophila]PIL39378.1 hypothetical protein CR103_12910 [Massilia psychrophila]GGE86905.1 hypothetical protein GCM10008020_34740 [Massilia psychrophila]